MASVGGGDGNESVPSSPRSPGSVLLDAKSVPAELQAPPPRRLIDSNIYIYISLVSIYILYIVIVYCSFRAPSVDHRGGVPARTRFSGAATLFDFASIGDWRLGEKLTK